MARVQERGLTLKEKGQLAHFSQQASRGLGLASGETTPQEIMGTVDARVDAMQATLRGGNAEKTAAQLVVGFGVVFGDQLVRRFGWEWVGLSAEGRNRYAVVNPDRSLAVYPMDFIKACLENPEMDCTVMLAFNMLAAGKLPSLPAGGYHNLMDGVRIIVQRL